MQKKKSIPFKAHEIIIFIVCLAGITESLLLFWGDLHLALERADRAPIATITFKYKAARRRFSDRVLWDRLRQDSPLYNGDTVHTESLAEATISFASGETLSMGENTICQIFDGKDGASADFFEGAVNAAAADGSGGFTLRSGISSITLDAGASVNASASPFAREDGGRGLLVGVQSGRVSFTSGGETRYAEAGSAFVTGAEGAAGNLAGAVMTYPEPNAVMLISSKKGSPVTFEWRAFSSSGGAAQGVRFEIARDYAFSDLIESIDVSNLTRLTVDLPQDGQYYWRLIPIENGKLLDDYGSGGKLRLAYTPPFSVIAPAQNWNVSYRTKKPAVRFIWSEQEYASAYVLEIATDARMNDIIYSRRLRSSSASVEVPGEGVYFWRVTPAWLFPFLDASESSAAEIQSFSVTRAESLRPLQIRSPGERAFVNIASDGGKTYFSWNSDPEALSYSFRLYRAQEETPIIEYTTENPWYVYDPAAVPLDAGIYRWNVSFTDAEYNRSPLSETRTVAAVIGNPELRSLWPPDGYNVSVALSADMRFVWHSNLTYGAKIQIARDRAFRDIVRESAVSGSSYTGESLREGTYYWRVVFNADENGGFILATDPRSFTSVLSLAAPLARFPMDRGLCVARLNVPTVFTWDAVENADYYQFKLLSSDGTVIYETLTEECSTSFAMYELNEGAWSWSVQAFREESGLSSRMTGLVSRGEFNLRILRPVLLESPSDGYAVEGLTAIRSPIKARWTSSERPQYSRLTAARSPFGSSDEEALRALSRGSYVVDLENPNYDAQFPTLGSGVYAWTVTARTWDGHDISSVKASVFRVLPIPPLPAARLVSPESDLLIDAKRLRESRALDFVWEAADGADAYYLTVKKIDGGGNSAVVLQTDALYTEEYRIENLGALGGAGSYVWELEAVAEIGGVFAERRGEIARSAFTIELPEIGAPRTFKPGVLYGN